MRAPSNAHVCTRTSVHLHTCTRTAHRSVCAHMHTCPRLCVHTHVPCPSAPPKGACPNFSVMGLSAQRLSHRALLGKALPTVRALWVAALLRGSPAIRTRTWAFWPPGPVFQRDQYPWLQGLTLGPTLVCPPQFTHLCSELRGHPPW